MKYLKIYQFLPVFIFISITSLCQTTDLGELRKRIVISDNVNLWDSYKISSQKSLIILKKNSVVIELDSINEYFKVQYVNPKTGSKYTGYIMKNFSLDEQSFNLYNKIKSQNDSISKVNKQKEIEDKELSMYQKYSFEDAIRIINHEIWIGMTKEMLIDSKGPPNSVNRDVGTWGVHEQLVYDKRYIYLENDKVTSWQD